MINVCSCFKARIINSFLFFSICDMQQILFLILITQVNVSIQTRMKHSRVRDTLEWTQMDN